MVSAGPKAAQPSSTAPATYTVALESVSEALDGLRNHARAGRKGCAQEPRRLDLPLRFGFFPTDHSGNFYQMPKLHFTTRLSGKFDCILRTRANSMKRRTENAFAAARRRAMHEG